MTTQENIPYTADEIKAMVKTCEKYNKALEKARELMDKGYDVLMPEIFPELQEDKDERIRKTIYGWIYTQPSEFFDNGFSKEEMLTWLEEQGKKKPTDEVEPKFHEGDFIVNDYCSGKIIEITNDAYLLDTDQGIPFSCEHNAHLWTIKDAKDGDVLMTTKTRNCPFIYRKTDYNNNLAYYYAGVDGNGDFCEGCLKRTMYHFGSVADITPATKEQRDLLFQKMKEAGYEWDADKKELKKIEPEFDDDNILSSLGNNQVQDILEDMGLLDDNGRCPHTAEEIFKAGMEHAFNLNREAASSVKLDAKNR